MMAQRGGGNGTNAVSVELQGVPKAGQAVCVDVSAPPGSTVTVTFLLTKEDGSGAKTETQTGAPGEFCLDVPTSYGGGTLSVDAQLDGYSNPVPTSLPEFDFID